VNSKRLSRLLSSVLVTLVASNAFPDIGPKPDPSYFRWKGGKAPADVELITVWLLECKTAECADAQPTSMPNKWFGCGPPGCYATAGFGFPPYAELSAKIAGRRVRSKPFKMSSGSFYDIDIQAGQVNVSEAARPFSDKDRRSIAQLPSQYRP